MEKVAYKLSTIDAIANLLIERTEIAPISGASLLTLTGALGAGKTTLVQSIARQLKVEEVVTSPTFVIMKYYQTQHPRYKTLVHIDAYRLENTKELKNLGFEELLDDYNLLICLEWPERVSALIPTRALSVCLSLVDDVTRTITYD